MRPAQRCQHTVAPATARTGPAGKGCCNVVPGVLYPSHEQNDRHREEQRRITFKEGIVVSYGKPYSSCCD